MTAVSIRHPVLIASLLIGWAVPSIGMAWQYNGYYPYYAPAPVMRYPPPRPPAPYYRDYYYPPPSDYRARPQPGQGMRPQADTDAQPSASENKPEKQRPTKGEIPSRKKSFVQKLLPHIQQENISLSRIRSRLVQLVTRLDTGQEVSASSTQWLRSLSRTYRVKGDPQNSPEARDELLRKVDIIPASLTLAQAANESGWGQSRFATEANNLFGIWTYDADKGLKPENRDAQKKHLVRKFEDAVDSIQYYMRMLNSHPAYRKLREIRASARQQGNTPNGMDMAMGLEKYSARGHDYIESIQQLIRQNRWALLDRVDAG